MLVPRVSPEYRPLGVRRGQGKGDAGGGAVRPGPWAEAGREGAVEGGVHAGREEREEREERREGEKRGDEGVGGRERERWERGLREREGGYGREREILNGAERGSASGLRAPPEVPEVRE